MSPPIAEFKPDDVDPIDFRSGGIGYNAARLTWRPSPYDCDVLGYTIADNNDDNISTYVAGKDSRAGNITGLMPETEYTFGIRTMTVFGERPVAAITKALTRVDPDPRE